MAAPVTKARLQLLVAGSAVLPALLGLWGGAQPLDDALITLRYARSLAQGDGFVFNPGERVLGTTTPLFTLVLATVHGVTSLDLLGVAYVAAFTAHLGCVATLARLGHRSGNTFVGWLAAALYGLAPLALHPSVGCMETSLFVLTTLWALAPNQGAPLWRSGAAVAAALLRPEGALTAALHIVGVWRECPRRAGRAVAVVAVGVAPWLLFATWYFGSPVPQSLSAKWTLHPWQPAWLAAENFWYLLVSLPIAGPKLGIASFVQKPFGTLIAQAVPIDAPIELRRLGVLGVGATVLLLAVLGAVVSYRRDRRFGPLLAFTVVYIFAYCIARPQMFPWYVVPPLPVLLLTFLTGAAVVLRAGLGRRQSAVAGTLAAALIGIAVWQSQRYLRSFPATLRVRGYRAAVAALGAAGQDRTVLIGAFEVGALGYYSQARILDLAGLVSPEVLPLGLTGSLERYRPDFCIGYDFGLGAAFASQYAPVARMADYTYQGKPLVIYRRRASAATDDGRPGNAAP